MSEAEANRLEDTISSVKKQFVQIMVGGIATIGVTMIGFYYNTQAAIQRHEASINRIETVLDKKADNTQIQQLNSDIKEVKSDVKDIYNLLLKNQK